MKVLLTGSSGWLGIHLYPLLKKEGYEPVGLDPVPAATTDAVGSVVDSNLIASLFEQHHFEAVIHAGALHKPDIVRFPRKAFVDVNVMGTLNLLEAAVKHEVKSFVFTSTTSLMVDVNIRNEESEEAVWLDETTGPLEPRNIYGVTKLAAESLCREFYLTEGLPTIVLRTARFFPEEDDTIREFSGPNLKANELLHRRATVEDMARAHIAALRGAPKLGFGLFVVSAPTPFSKDELGILKQKPQLLLEQKYQDIGAIYAKQGWHLPKSIGRVYDGSRITRELNFEYNTSFDALIEALRKGSNLPISHNPDYSSPLSLPQTPQNPDQK